MQIDCFATYLLKYFLTLYTYFLLKNVYDIFNLMKMISAFRSLVLAYLFYI